MPATPIFALPYPRSDGTDTNDVPRDIKALADRIEVVLPTTARSRPAVRLTNSANIAANINTFNTVTFDTESFDTDGMHSAANPSRITFNTAGIYQVLGHIYWQPLGPDGDRILRFLLNGATTVAQIVQRTLADAGRSPEFALATLYQFAAGDYIEMQATWYYPSGAGQINILTGQPRTPMFGAVQVST